MDIKSSIVFATVGLYRKASWLELQCVHFFYGSGTLYRLQSNQELQVQRHVNGEKVPSVGAVGVIECKKPLC